ncbi:hypothetical protein [Marinilabilia salmonicolor]|jgi:hypothetical protein|uniref:Universal stress protein family protein n=1 Tax=Marinilabilia salmonicolor TaxID=989 RepID=A0A368V8E6_9BACT|nr:hypothetical protein [Marinilabilia salmonicolor]RCW35261.1 hypothetical protein DFO77_11026 [Marinilabilia salmonicolor]
MASLLLPISPDDDINKILPAVKQIAGFTDYTIIPFTYKISGKKYRTQTNSNAGNIRSSENDLFKTIHSFLFPNDDDIALVVISPQVINLQSRNKATHFFSKFRNLQVPYLVLPDKPEDTWHPKEIYFPVCLKDGEKEASAWAGFWSRTFEAKLHLLNPHFRNKTTNQYLQRTMAFIRNLLQKSNVSYDISSEGHTRKEARQKALELAKNSPDTLIVMPATRLNSPEYVFIGPPEIRLLKNRGNTPVLFVNPRHDMYVPCG